MHVPMEMAIARGIMTLLDLTKSFTARGKAPQQCGQCAAMEISVRKETKLLADVPAL